MNTPKSTGGNERRSASCGPLWENDSVFAFLFERTSDAVWMIDPGTGAVLNCNEATAVLMRCASRIDLVGKRLEELSAAGQEVGLSIVEAVQCIVEGFENRSSRFDWKARRLDGTEVTLEGNVTAIERDGEKLIVLVSREAGGAREEAGSPLLGSEAEFGFFFE